MLSVILSLVGCEWKQTTQEDQKVAAQTKVEDAKVPNTTAKASDVTATKSAEIDNFILETN